MTGQAYNTIHKWVSYHLSKTGTCSSCGASGLSGKMIHWANISRQYKRDLNDWQELCAKCHQKYDGRYKESSNFYATCLECNDIFSLSPSRVGVTKYCSRDCYSSARVNTNMSIDKRRI